jgi:hypothetical protein
LAGRRRTSATDAEVAGAARYIVADICGTWADRGDKNMRHRVILLRKVDRNKTARVRAAAAVNRNTAGCIRAAHGGGTTATQPIPIAATWCRATDNDVASKGEVVVECQAICNQLCCRYCAAEATVARCCQVAGRQLALNTCVARYGQILSDLYVVEGALPRNGDARQ